MAFILLAVSSASGWPASGLTVAAIAAILIVLPVLAPLEVLLGPLMMAAAMACSAGLAFVVPLVLDGSRQMDAATIMMVAFALQGLALGVFQGASTRPFCFLPGSLGQLVAPWWASAVLGALGLLVLFWGLGMYSAVYCLLAFAGGTVLGLIIQMTGLASEPPGSGAMDHTQLADSLNKAQEHLDARRVTDAQRAIEAIHLAAPDYAPAQQLRYSIWKFEPKLAQFHQAAGALLSRPESQGASKDVTTALYKDYLAVAQGRPQLDADMHIALAHRFADWDVTDHSANIINVYLQRDPRNRSLPQAMLALAEAYVRAENPGRAGYFAETLLTLMPTTSEAHLAQRLLRQVKPKRD
ncbi:MAG: tol-pal system YbgF family protein [Lysobacterales bacterium]